ncbi:hypothetical protein DFH46_005150 [Clostridium beijerinckii]|nr:hypothetical protein [Clostridium beijerinckii]NRW82529.1 hypothetical protein [Clostridium beijerinckii]
MIYIESKENNLFKNTKSLKKEKIGLKQVDI